MTRQQYVPHGERYRGKWIEECTTGLGWVSPLPVPEYVVIDRQGRRLTVRASVTAARAYIDGDWSPRFQGFAPLVTRRPAGNREGLTT